ncbi:M24 family metallopeptidase [Calderihabitans maritimus]|uniref:Peptidase M24 n=1 Tax=Calderihabitans maritimus TaxID=1246530 RepID=A0A1Z5HVV4_9FIRM|nr:Xaa-Pro peptidase family protein [Calderihabitans maritimus]GAW93666.1 peptidase M24 [Calderihabitans maritimus]
MEHTPAEECYRRIEKLQHALQEQNLDGALILYRADLFYFTGTAQQAYLYVPVTGESLLMVKKDFERAQKESPLRHVVYLPSQRKVIEIMKSFGCYQPKAHIGMELDVLPVRHFRWYQEHFPEWQIVDIGSTIREIRMIKSPYEIDLLKQSARLQEKVFSNIAQELKPGISELELAARIEFFARRSGHQGGVRLRGFDQELFYGNLMSGKSGAVKSYFDGPTGGPGPSPAYPLGAGWKIVEENEPIFIDYVGLYNGYIVDMTRIFVIGSLPEKLVKAHQVALEIQEALVEAARPGAVCQDLYQMALDMAESSGFGAHFMGYGEKVSFVGHGVGLELDELPVIARKFPVSLQEGMVIALEPKFIFPEYGTVGIENTFVVRKNGLEKLTQFEEQIIQL